MQTEGRSAVARGCRGRGWRRIAPVVELEVVMAAQFCKYAKNHWIIYFKMVLHEYYPNKTKQSS